MFGHHMYSVSARGLTVGQWLRAKSDRRIAYGFVTMTRREKRQARKESRESRKEARRKARAEQSSMFARASQSFQRQFQRKI